MGSQATRTREFVQLLSKNTSIPVITEDERLSTVDAANILNSNHPKLNKKRKPLDAYAAAIILQRFLDRLNN